MFVREIAPPAYVIREIDVDEIAMTAPRSVAAMLRAWPVNGVSLESLAVEAFGVVLLDAKHRLIAVQTVSVGILDAALTHPREVFRAAISQGTAAVILFHNHPSGVAWPSPDDHALTSRMVSAGDLLGIKVLDHIVIAGAGYHSFQEAGTL